MEEKIDAMTEKSEDTSTMDYAKLIQQSIIKDMSEGVMVINFDGKIAHVNPAASRILGRTREELKGNAFAKCFFDNSNNDSFNQTILDAVYDRDHTHENYVHYDTGSEIKQLHVTTSFLTRGGEKLGIIVVLGDISELSELRDAVKAMEKIQGLNKQLEMRNKLLNEAFGRFLSDEIVRQLLETPDGLALGGRKNTLTIMMSDLRGFTAMSERMDAESLVSMLNHYLGEMTEIIEKRDGTIIEFIGDGILAIFGAPVHTLSHASDAVAAAVEMQHDMSVVNAWNLEHGYPELEMGIGINTGEVIVGNIGSEIRTKYGVVGAHVNLCGRIESYTVGGQILVSPMTMECIKEDVTVEAVEEVFPKGTDKPLRLSHVTGIGGKYAVSCRTVLEEPAALAAPLPVEYLIIRDKHVSNVPDKGEFIAISHTGAVLETEKELKLYENLQIEAGCRIYAKVTKQAEGEGNGCRYNIRFTSLPVEFDPWYDDITGKK